MDAVLGVMAATVISLLNVAALTIWAMVGAANVQSAVTAAHMRVWDAGALQYVKDFVSTIAATATATTPVTVTTAMMAAAGNYLPLGYSGVNPFGQTLELQVLQPTAGQLQAIVTSQGGRSISDPKQLVQIAAQAQAPAPRLPHRADTLPRFAFSTRLAVSVASGTDPAFRLCLF